MTARLLYVIEANGLTLDQGAFLLEDDAYEAADEARYELGEAAKIEVVPYVPMVKVMS